MYCAKCGKMILDGSAFCPSCGAKQGMAVDNAPVANSNPMGYGLNITQINQETVNAIYRLLDPLKKIADENNKMDQNIRRQNYYQRKLNNTSFYYVMGGVGGFFSTFLFIIMFLRPESPKWTFPLAFIICTAGGILIGHYIVREAKKIVNKCQNNTDASLKNINDICQFVDPNDIALLPPSYRYYNAALFFYNAFINQRAYTMQQAVNLYEDEMRKDQMAMMQQQQMASLRSIQTTSAVSATMSTLNFISRLF